MLLHKMRDKHFWTGFDTASQTIRTISNAALAIGIIYSFVAWFLLSAMSAKFYHSCGPELGCSTSFLHDGGIRWLIALVGTPFIAKEFFSRDKRVAMVLNLGYVCFLLCLTMSWVDTLFRSHIH